MKKIEAILRPFKLAKVKEAREQEEIRGMTTFEIKGSGQQMGRVKLYRERRIGRRYLGRCHAGRPMPT